MPNVTAVGASAAFLAAAVLSDLKSTPTSAPAATAAVSVAAASANAPPAVASTASAAPLAAGGPGAQAAPVTAATSPISFSGKIQADQSRCDPLCKYFGIFSVVNNGPQATVLELDARLATVRGQYLRAKIEPNKIQIAKYDGAVVPISLTPLDPDCQGTWKWVESFPFFTRPAPTGCMPATGYGLIRITMIPDAAPAAAPRGSPQGARAIQKPDPPKILQQRIDLGVSVPSPAGLEGSLTMWTAILAGVLTAATLVGLGIKKVFSHTIGFSDLDFDKSLVANVSFAGLLLTAVGLATVLPDNTQLMAKQSYAALSVFGAVLTLLAPAVFHMGQRRVQVDGAEQLVGRVWITAVAGGLLLWGAIVEIGSFWLQLIEVSESRTITLESLALFSFLLLAITIGLCFYVPISVITTAHRESESVAPTPAGDGKIALTRTTVPAVTRTPGTWSLP